jgi:FkbM family methyltransferase
MSKVDAVKFVLRCQNWFEAALPIATHREPARIILKNGIRFESHAIYWADMHSIIFQGIYTPPYLPIEKNDVVVDVGANIGVFTAYAAFRTRKAVYAFEPFPDNYAALEQNMRANRLSNVTTHMAAISDKSGTELISVADKSQHHRLKKFAHGVSGKYIEIPSMTLQEIMDDNNLKQIDFLKLDCEGAEAPILLSTSREYLLRVKKIALEFHDHLSEITHVQLQKLLEDAGFTTRLEWDGKSVLGFIYAWRG